MAVEETTTLKCPLEEQALLRVHATKFLKNIDHAGVYSAFREDFLARRGPQKPKTGFL